jgi:hypothetical protein
MWNSEVIADVWRFKMKEAADLDWETLFGIEF